MTRTKHILWSAAAVLAFHIFIISLWSDVWEAFLTLFLAIGALYFLAIRRHRRLRGAVVRREADSKTRNLGFSS